MGGYTYCALLLEGRPAPLRAPCHSRDPSARLPQVQHRPGYLVNLLRVAMEGGIDASVRQVAAITFKNLVKRDWEHAGEKGRCVCCLSVG